MVFIYDYEHLTPFQIKTVYTNEINEYKRKEKALKQVIDSFEDNSYIDKAKLNELKENLCQIRLYISNLESELNILTL